MEGQSDIIGVCAPQLQAWTTVLDMFGALWQLF
jgi:hypothetical protein